MLIEVIKHECTFLGMPLGREESKNGKKGKLIYSQESEVFGDVGEMDAKKDSPSFGQKVCKVGKTYVLDQWQYAKYGAAFEKGKEVKGYVIDDGRTDEEEALARKLAKEATAKRKAAEEAETKKEQDKAEKERIAAGKKALDDAIAAKTPKEEPKEEKKKK